MTGEASDAVIVRRLLPVAREVVFSAWLDPATIGEWMCPGEGSATAELDPRVGGAFRIVMRHAGGVTEHRGIYLAIDPPSLLSFTWISVNTDMRETIVTVELTERDAATELVLTHRRLPAARRPAHEWGWTDILGKLAQVLHP